MIRQPLSWCTVICLGFALTLSLTANAQDEVATSPPLNGTIVKYSCEGAGSPNENHRVLYSKGSLWGIQVVSSQQPKTKKANNKNSKAKPAGPSTETSSFQDVSPWQYLLATPSFEETPDSFRIFQVKSGDLADLNTLVAGKTHNGVLEVSDPSAGKKPYRVSVSVEVGEYEREKTKFLRFQKVVKLKIKYENLNNDDKITNSVVHFSPTLKSVIFRSISPEEGEDRSCWTKKMAYDQKIRKSRNKVQLRLPQKASEFSYICDGKPRILQYNVDKVSPEGFVELRMVHDHGKDFNQWGEPWQIYTFIAPIYLPGFPPPTIDTVGGFDGLKHPQRPGSYVGGVTITTKGKAAKWQAKVTVFDKTKLKSPYRGTQDVFEVRTTRFKGSDYVISKVYYSEKEGVPFMFDVKSSGELNRSCWLTSSR